jgi:hypothetical protein
MLERVNLRERVQSALQLRRLVPGTVGVRPEVGHEEDGVRAGEGGEEGRRVVEVGVDDGNVCSAEGEGFGGRGGAG